MKKLLFHIHTKYSHDSNLEIKDINNFCNNEKVDYLAITDHNTIQGTREVQSKIKTVKVIIGEEIMTQDGDIIGLFLKKEIKPRLSLEKTICEIKKQNGIVIAPHPCDILRREAIGEKKLLEYIDKIDIIETFNARNLLQTSNERAREIAKKYQKKSIVGSDAHIIGELQNSFIMIDNFFSKTEFLQNLNHTKVTVKHSGIFPHILSKWIKIKKKNARKI